MLAIQEKQESVLFMADKREVWLSHKHNDELKRRYQETRIPVSAQIIHALNHWLTVEPDNKHHRKAFVDPQGKPNLKRKLMHVPDALWEKLDARSDESGLDLYEQTQIAVGLFLEQDLSANHSQSFTLESAIIQPPTPEEEARLNQLVEEKVEQALIKKVPSLIERLRAEGKEVFPAVPAIIQPIFKGELIMEVVCGNGSELENLVQPLGEGVSIEITGRLAGIATAHSFFARANGWSMKDDDSKTDIRPGDILLMTPLEEYKKTIRPGVLVLVEVTFKNGQTVSTLKTWTGKQLRANNPSFKPVEFGPDVEGARVIAVCRGAVERVFD